MTGFHPSERAIQDGLVSQTQLDHLFAPRIHTHRCKSEAEYEAHAAGAIVPSVHVVSETIPWLHDSVQIISPGGQSFTAQLTLVNQPEVRLPNQYLVMFLSPGGRWFRGEQ